MSNWVAILLALFALFVAFRALALSRGHAKLIELGVAELQREKAQNWADLREKFAQEMSAVNKDGV